jgi:pimeloyl-ACP methyl ester carboxylesterase
MPQSPLAVPTQDGKLIHGVLRETGSRRLVVHMHGLTHNKDCYLEILSAEYAEERGYDCFRFGFYERLPKARTLDSITLMDHVRDFGTVLAHLRDRYDAIYVSGHSLGGLTALIANPEGVRAMSLWDPPTDTTHFWRVVGGLRFVPEIDKYMLDYGRTFVVGKELVEEFKEYPDAQCLELARRARTPVQFVIPEETMFLASPHASPERYAEAFPNGFALYRMKKANHIFSYEGNRQELFRACYDFFDAHG